MAATRSLRRYDIVLVGAIGYTGTIAAEHIANYLPTNLRWAVAGRSSTKLESLCSRLSTINPDRLRPDIEIVSVDNETSLRNLVKQARVCLSVVSYTTAGHFVISACIEEQTDYVDTSGGAVLLRRWIDKYQEKAVANGVKLVLSCGMLSGLFDLVALATIQGLSEKHSLDTEELILCDIEVPVEISGGTAHTIEVMQLEDSQAVKESADPWHLCPRRQGADYHAKKLTNGIGLRRDPVLGLLSDSTVGGDGNRQIVNWTWALLSDPDQGVKEKKGYGPTFQYNEYSKVSSTLDGLFRKLSSTILLLLMSLKIGAMLVRLFAPPPGEGPDTEKSRRLPVKLEAHAIAAPQSNGTSPRVRTTFSYMGGPYIITGMLLAEGAASLLYNHEELHSFAGFITPAILGKDLLQRVQTAGASIEISDV
ncbi:Saccharopine dehydrogenase-domain-containing protein [Xylariaceae sp. FL0255]|nr:Saccharopine dehydrogenase-domain-containing protein [Xylariaceae sp. FL0255]